MSEAFSATAMITEQGWPVTCVGNTDASATRKFLIPCTRSSASTTLLAESRPIRAVLIYSASESSEYTWIRLEETWSDYETYRVVFRQPVPSYEVLEVFVCCSIGVDITYPPDALGVCRLWTQIQHRCERFDAREPLGKAYRTNDDVEICLRRKVAVG